MIGPQLGRFALVGASGYVVNLVTFAAVVRAGGHARVAATCAFLVAVTSNFWWHRRWTFVARHGHPVGQGARFLAVSVAGFLVSLAALSLLVDALHVPAVPAQVLATAGWIPCSYALNRGWTFGRASSTSTRRPA